MPHMTGCDSTTTWFAQRAQAACYAGGLASGLPFVRLLRYLAMVRPQRCALTTNQRAYESTLADKERGFPFSRPSRTLHRARPCAVTKQQLASRCDPLLQPFPNVVMAIAANSPLIAKLTEVKT